MRNTSATRRTPRAVLVACAAMAVAATTTPAFAAPGSASPPPGARGPVWTASQVAADDATAITTTRVDAHTTWVAGMRFLHQSGGLRFQPVIWERDDRTGPGWKELATAPVPEYDTRFNDVDASSRRNALAVGDHSEAAQGIVTQRWDGTKWRTAIAPVSPGSWGAGFLSVESLSPRDGWAVGWDQVPSPDGSRSVGQIQHWDGQQWTRSDLPDVDEGPGGGWTLAEVSARNSRDVWAVGGTFSREKAVPVALHYDGSAWKRTDLPAIGERARLNGVAAAPDGTVWAVGEIAARGGPSTGLALRYDGTQWTRTALPEGTGALTSVTLSEGAPVVLVKSNERVPSVLRLAGNTWKSMDLPTAVGGARLTALSLSAYDDTLDVSGVLDAGAARPAVVLTARR
ncbi:hypothetical protein [Streptomyces yaizuensis]|uniref:Uncharacterized protein n=1 Tax=Streptomyces yaizuensis TaxID=2989713 RepID=A0ABQ5NQJ3_9ACTN|nr:hypothetical protein [Streptomyces sp. YSPA8]GLF92652.1 hypothetical protein SYYSPA8_00165 [Streptomyces sp. YSPA8]